MKTSNKIFLGLIAAIALNVLTGMIFLRNSLGPKGMGDGLTKVIGKGTLKTKKLAVSNFSKLYLDGHYEVIISQGEEFLEVTSDENIVDYFSSKITKEGQLILSVNEEYTLQPQGAVQVKLGFKNLSEIEIAGKTVITSMDTLRFENLHLNIQNISKASLALVVANNLHIWMKDIGEANLTGSAVNTKIELRDIAKLHAAKLTLQNTSIETRDMSFADLNILKSINAQAADQSTIEYTGQPKGHAENRDMSRISKK